MVVAQLVRASDCDSEGRGFEPHHPPQIKFLQAMRDFFCLSSFAEVTIRFWQEAYDDKNILREIHEKYPVNKGHKKLI